MASTLHLCLATGCRHGSRVRPERPGVPSPSCTPGQVEDPSKYGVVVMDDAGKVDRFVEKPKVGSSG